MYLQPLVEHLNDAFSREHRTSFRPFVLEGNLVSGIFGPIRISSLFTPIRTNKSPETIIGHKAQINVSTFETKRLYSEEVENLLSYDRNAAVSESIVNFDRLCRTVHLLNYLPIVPLQRRIFLEVDPRHILGVKKDHGAYFEDIIERCGLSTKNIVILTTLSSQYAKYYQELHNGLSNYKQRGYQIAVKFDVESGKNESFDFISKLSLDYVCFSVGDLELPKDQVQLDRLNQLKTLVNAIGAQSILKQANQKQAEQIARTVGFDLVHGSYYADIPHVNANLASAVAA
ncbi:hypothetical protein JCM14076_18610 [Methylosoma difficile]